MEWKSRDRKRERERGVGEERFLKWVMGMERETPGYLLRVELQREKLKGRVGRTAWRFEEKLRGGEGNELARLSLTEMEEKDREKKVDSKWEEERRVFFEERVLRREEMEEGGDEWFEGGEKMDRKKQKKRKHRRG